ncbi:formate dehydrogenase major subunit [Desulforhopalus singaporensis]|uniref:Formate dehydrogenase major subunit n=2 Tax=Desulforhopalus singaporensis TaxID=91360 RepID=A0A1H0SSS1_9BACT|nr:formate dehydrogenase major subunit [Desulforhopalus singaporensis]
MPEIDTLFLFGSNPTEAHPIIGFYLKKALQNGAKLIVGDPRKTWMAKRADVWLNVRPGQNIALLNSIIHVILKNGWENRKFIEERCENFSELKEKVQEYDPVSVERITGVAASQIEEAAYLYAHAEKAMIVYGLGVTEHISGTENAMAIANLALVCGQIGRPSTGIMALRGQNNVQGASDLGPAPTILPGYQQLSDNDVRAKFAKAWNVEIPKEPGLKSVEMLDACVEGRFKGIFILGEDPAQTDPDLNHVCKALEKVDFLVVQDIFHTETTRFADVILPGASFAEKDGTFTNGERRIQRVRKAVEPLAGMAEWEVVSLLATRMGYPMSYSGPSEIMDEIASLVPIYGGVSYDRLKSGGLQWPCPDKDHPGTSTLYTDLFSRPNGKAWFNGLDQHQPGETADQEYPFTLITGRRREHYNNGSQTRRCQGIDRIVAAEKVEINPEDAERLGIISGNLLRVSSRRGEVRVKARVTDRSQPGCLFMTFHHQSCLTNLLTSEHRDPITGTPEYKVSAVRIEPVVDKVK